MLPTVASKLAPTVLPLICIQQRRCQVHQRPRLLERRCVAAIASHRREFPFDLRAGEHAHGGTRALVLALLVDGLLDQEVSVREGRDLRQVRHDHDLMVRRDFAELLPHLQPEAAADLGARPFKAFFKITLPLSMPGIVAGCLLVFIPAVGEFVIPSLLGRTDQLMIGTVLSAQFFGARNWPVASAVAIGLLLVLLLPILLFQRYQQRELEASRR